MTRQTMQSKAILVFAMALVWAALGTGCGKKSDGQQAAPPPPVVGPVGPSWGGCAGCSGNVSLIASAMGQTLMSGQIGMELQLEFYGDSAYAQQYAGGGINSGFSSVGISGYTGVVQARGVLRVYNTYTANGCFIPPGQYDVQTVTPGQWFSQKSFAGLMLVANGPAQLSITLNNNFLLDAVPPAVSQDGHSFPFRLASGGGGNLVYPVGGNSYTNSVGQPVANQCYTGNATYSFF